MLRVQGAPLPLKAEITKRLTIDNPEYKKRKAQRRPTWGLDAKIKLYSESSGTLVLPRGFERELGEIIYTKGFDPLWTDATQPGRVFSNYGTWAESFKIREQQEKCIEDISKGNGCLVAPAGSGKTIMGLRFVFDKGRTALWLTHTIDLLNQTIARAEACMPDIGKVGRVAEGAVDWGDGKLIVATYQTLMKNDALIDQLNQIIGVAVIDECHHASSDCFAEVVNKLTAKYRLGLTATPDRKDGLEALMYQTIGPKLHEINRQALYDGGRLVKPEIRFIYTGFSYDPASVTSESGAVDAGGEELNYQELTRRLITDEDRLALIAENIIKCSGFQLVISDSIPYCHAIYQALQLQGIPGYTRIEVVHGTLQKTKWVVARSEADAHRQMREGKAKNAKFDPRAKRWKVQIESYSPQQLEEWNVRPAMRKQIMQDAADRRIDILIATGQLVQEGLDLPHLNYGHLVTPKRGDANGANNGISVEQAIGRLMRPDPRVENKTAVWFDYVDSRCSVLKSQYFSRRKVYDRLGLHVPRKPPGKKEETSSFLSSLKW